MAEHLGVPHWFLNILKPAVCLRSHTSTHALGTFECISLFTLINKATVHFEYLDGVLKMVKMLSSTAHFLPFLPSPSDCCGCVGGSAVLVWDLDCHE